MCHISPVYSDRSAVMKFALPGHRTCAETLFFRQFLAGLKVSILPLFLPFYGSFSVINASFTDAI
jgi:hypothetical protein